MPEVNRKFSVDEEPQIRAQIVTEARSWVYTPFRAGAQLKGIAADCAGLLFGVLIAAGLSTTEQAKAAKIRGRGKSYLTGETEWLLQIAQSLGVMIFKGQFGASSPEDQQPGNVVLLRPKTSKVFCHIGILAGADRVVHAYKHCIAESGVNSHHYWAGRDVAIFDPFLIPSEEAQHEPNSQPEVVRVGRGFFGAAQ